MLSYDNMHMYVLNLYMHTFATCCLCDTRDSGTYLAIQVFGFQVGSREAWASQSLASVGYICYRSQSGDRLYGQHSYDVTMAVSMASKRKSAIFEGKYTAMQDYHK